MVEHLKRHGVAVEVMRFSTGEGDIGKTILAKAKELHADMIVMGAFHHSRWREFILGGVTLDHARGSTHPVVHGSLISMTVHLLKLCVGVETVQELADWQSERLKRLKRERKRVELCHRTLQTPKRRDEVLDGGSLYWVIKGFVLVRQRVLDLRPDTKEDGTACCGIVLERALVTTRAAPAPRLPGLALSRGGRRAADIRGFEEDADEMPPAMREDLRELSLIDW